jgi:hypothetical protein
MEMELELKLELEQQQQPRRLCTTAVGGQRRQPLLQSAIM